MQVKHLLLLVVLILMIPPGFYYLMNSTAKKEPPAPFAYEVLKTDPETISVKIKDDGTPSLETAYAQQFVSKLESTPSWLLQDATFQGCVNRAVDTCVANTTQREVQFLQSDTLCDALPADEAANCKNQYHHTQAIKNKDISLCEKISNQFQRLACQNGVFTQKALETRDGRWCDKVVSAAGPAASDLVSPEKQNCLNLLDLQKGAADSTLLNNNWAEGSIQETVLD